MRPALRTLLAASSIVAAMLSIGGCAAPSAYQQGNQLVKEGRLDEALVRYEEALRLQPSSIEYRAAYLRTRENLVSEILTRADQARERNDFAAAEAGYRRVVAMVGINDRALAGLRAIDNRQRWDRWLKEAEAAAARKDWDAVRSTLKPLLLESPNDPRALELMNQAARAAAAPPKADKALAAAFRKPISIEFRDTALRTVFEVISRTSGLNFVFDKDIRGDQRTSIQLRNSTVEAAVSMLLASNQLDQKVLDPNTILIYPNTAAKQTEHQMLVVRSFYLANADAKTVGAALKTLLKSREVVIDERLNLVIVRDSADAMRIAERVVALHDMAEAEVMLEVAILEVKRTRLIDLGIRWPESVVLTPLPSTTGGPLTLNDLLNLTSGTVGVGIGPMIINARKTDTDADLLANPRIRTRNRDKAKIHIGERVPNITTTATSTGFVSESVTYIDIGLRLEVEPTVYLDNEVAIKVSLEVSNIISQVQTKSGTLAYQIGTRTASTVLRLKDGENQVLAGLIADEDRRTGHKLPGLGDMPVLGRLFGSQLDEAAKTEILLSITPRILRNLQRPDGSMIEFDSGTGINVGARGPDGAAAAELPTARPAAPLPAQPGTPPAQPPATPPTLQPGSPSTAPTGALPAGDAARAAPGVADSALAAQPAQPGSLTTRLLGPATARVGDVVSVRVVAQSSQAVGALPMVVGFDPAVLQPTAVSEGEFLRQGGAATTFSSQVDPAGQVLITAARSGGTAAAAAGAEAAVATLSFRVLAGAGSETRVLLQRLSPTGPTGVALAGPLPQPLVLTIAP